MQNNTELQREADEAVRVMKAGGIILYPTDTVWGLGCDATNAEAVERIYKLKRSENKKSMLVLCASADMIVRYVNKAPGIAFEVMELATSPLTAILPGDYQGSVLFVFENGKAAKVPLSAYETKTNRKKLTGAYSDKSPLIKAVALDADEQMVVYSTDGRAAIFSTAQLLPKTTRNTQGVAVMTLKKKATLRDAVLLTQSGIVNESRYRTKTIPSAGAVLKEEDSAEKQQTFEV